MSLAVARSGEAPITFVAQRKYACSDYPSLLEIIRTFLDECGEGDIRRGVLACAGYVVDGVLINTNLAWGINVHALREALRLDDLALINDFEAAAYGTQHAELKASTWLTSRHDGDGNGARVVMGAGTGLGSAVLLPGPGRLRVLTAEAGQVALAAGNQLEADIVRVLRDAGGRHVPYERVLSGPGLLNVYRALCTLAGDAAPLSTPEAVSMAAVAGDDPHARRTIDVFYGLFGSLVGDLAMLYNATGGITLIGSVLAGTRPFLFSGPFLERFTDKGHMRRFVETVPVRVVDMDELGVIGAASWYVHHRVRAPDADHSRDRYDTRKAGRTDRGSAHALDVPGA